MAEANVTPVEVSCPPRDEDYEAAKEVIEFWMDGVAVLAISVVGLLGNCLAVPLLFSKVGIPPLKCSILSFALSFVMSSRVSNC